MLKALFARPMTRKEFLLLGGAVIISVTGVSGILKNLQNGSFFERYKKVDKGYGSKGYGI